MFAILGLIGVAMSAAVFVDFGAEAEDADDETPQDGDEQVKIVSVSSLLSDGGEAMPGTENLTPGEDGAEDQTQAPQIIYAGDEDSTLASAAGDDFLYGGEGADDIRGGAGQDELHGERGDDVIYGEDGNDDIFGHVGDDTLYGGAGDDTLTGGDGHDHIEGGDGDDTLTGYHGDDVLIGGKGADMLNGGEGSDIIDGRDDDAKDFLNGGAGDDRIIAGIDDHLNGGTGADTFAVLKGTGAFVDDFDPAEDILEIAYDTVPPILTTALGDGGLTVLADGEAVATLGGITALDLTTVKLVAL